MNEQLINLQFVQEVEKHPCLYNYTLTEYSRKDVTEKAWSEVGKTVNLSGSQCKEKWKNLRAVFVRHLKPSPSGPSAKMRKPYYLTEAMQFTIPFIKTLNKECVYLPDVYHEEIDEEDDTKLHLLRTSPSPNPPNSSMSLSCSLATPLTPPSQNVDTGIKRKMSESITAYDNNVKDYFIPKRTNTEQMADDKINCRKMFLLSLLDDVYSMSDIQMRIFKRKVLEIIDEILE